MEPFAEGVRVLRVRGHFVGKPDSILVPADDLESCSGGRGRYAGAQRRPRVPTRVNRASTRGHVDASDDEREDEDC